MFGKWRVSIEEGHYNIRVIFIKPVKAPGRMYIEANTLIRQMRNEKNNTDVIEMKNVYFPKMDGDLIPFYAGDKKRIFPLWVEMERVD